MGIPVPSPLLLSSWAPVRFSQSGQVQNPPPPLDGGLLHSRIRKYLSSVFSLFLGYSLVFVSSMCSPFSPGLISRYDSAPFLPSPYISGNTCRFRPMLCFCRARPLPQPHRPPYLFPEWLRADIGQDAAVISVSMNEQPFCVVSVT